MAETKVTFPGEIDPSWDGWAVFTEALTYASGSGTNVGTFTAPGDLTSKYYAGMKGKFTQTTVKYFFITKVAHAAGTTTFTAYFGTDYTIANAAISGAYFSMMRTPAGFPLDPDKWTITTTDSSDRAVTSTTLSTMTATIVVPIGLWRLRLWGFLNVTTDASTTARRGLATLSSDASTETNPSTTIFKLSRSETAAVGGAGSTLMGEDFVTLAASTTFTMMGKVTAAGPTITMQGAALQPTIITALCAYL